MSYDIPYEPGSNSSHKDNLYENDSTSNQEKQAADETDAATKNGDDCSSAQNR